MTFDELLTDTLNMPGLLHGNEPLDEERKQFERESRCASEPVLLTDVRISDRAIRMIVGLEITNEAAYNAQYRHPVWPHGQSGVTIGIGYDLGYVTPAQFRRDWQADIGADAVARLTLCCGKSGESAHQLLAQVKTVEVPFAAANNVFRSVVVLRYIARTLGALPSAASALTADCLGALVSLAYNRGASFQAPGDRYREMRAIYGDIPENLPDIPSQIRLMKRLWNNKPGMVGLLWRRDLEAQLFQEGLDKLS